jgi:two-component system LytT family response regulator
MPTRALIVDDEPLARRKIRTFLKDHHDIEVVAECANGLDATTSIMSLWPDLLFLDIRIPDRDGFEVLRSVDPGKLPAVIFTTAYDEYAVKAFDINALDYLLKPFNRRRFDDAITRFRTREAGGTPRRGRFLDWLQSNREFTSSKARLVVRSNGRILLIDPASVQWIRAEGDYVRLHVGNSTYLMRETMHSLEARLDPRRFVRIHRSLIVNLDFVAGFKPLPGGDYRVFVRDGPELILSRTFRKQLSLKGVSSPH